MNRFLCCISAMTCFRFPFSHLNLWSISHTDSSGFCLIYIISFMYLSSELGFWNSFINNFLISPIVLVVPSELFAIKLKYQFSVRSLNVITNCSSLVSSSVIYFSSQIFSQINTCFYRSSDASPLNSGNLMVGSCPAILNVELLPSRGVDT
jgi:hypothetical protein